MFSHARVPSFAWGLTLALLALVLLVEVGAFAHRLSIVLLAVGLLFTQGVFPFALDIMHTARTTRDKNFIDTLIRTLAFGGGMLLTGSLLALGVTSVTRAAIEYGVVNIRGVYIVIGVVAVLGYVSILRGLRLLPEFKYSTRERLFNGRHPLMRSFTSGVYAFLDRRTGWPFTLWLIGCAIVQVGRPGAAMMSFALAAFVVVVCILVLALLSRLYLSFDMSRKYAVMMPVMQNAYLWALLLILTPNIMALGAGSRFIDFGYGDLFEFGLLGVPMLLVWMHSINGVRHRAKHLSESDWSDIVSRTTLLVASLLIAFVYAFW
jgi:hypothetical protein